TARPEARGRKLQATRRSEGQGSQPRRDGRRADARVRLASGRAADGGSRSNLPTTGVRTTVRPKGDRAQVAGDLGARAHLGGAERPGERRPPRKVLRARDAALS